jgi:hypothetical protein
MTLGKHHAKRLLAVLVFVVAVGGGEALADCGPTYAPRVNVDVILPSIPQDFTQTSAALQAAHPDRADGRQNIVLGLTNYGSFFELLPVTTLVTQPDGSICASLSSEEVRFGYNKVTVYVTNGLFGEGCLTDHVLAHERHHVEILWQTLAEFAPIMEAEVLASANAIGVIHVANRQEAQQIIREALKPAVDNVFADFSQTLDQRQAEFDSPAEYARNRTVCGGRLNAIINRIR